MIKKVLDKKEISVEISARHIHLSQKDLDKLFGKGHRLKKLKKLFQPREFAAKETLEVRGNSEKILNFRVVGPIQKETQVELSKTDAVALRIAAPIRDSGNLEGTPGAVLIGPQGKMKLKKGVINNWRHLHCNFKEAQKMGLKDKALISIKVNGLGAVTFHNVRVRLGKRSRPCLHLDTDEGNAADIKARGKGKIILC